ncbi:MAG TPA: hypothetical protein VFR24_05380 [Candidatus Angelobacter sp.]|nr:hypothetical protein [Candidatus Angelobacter sp.]
MAKDSNIRTQRQFRYFVNQEMLATHVDLARRRMAVLVIALEGHTPQNIDLLVLSWYRDFLYADIAFRIACLPKAVTADNCNRPLGSFPLRGDVLWEFYRLGTRNAAEPAPEFSRHIAPQRPQL